MEYEYAEIVASLTLRFDDLSGSIKKSEITKKLIGMGSDSRVRALLGIA